MRNQLIKSMKYNESVDMMYMAANGKVKKRRIDILRVGEGAFQAFCHLRKAKRTFRIDNVRTCSCNHERKTGDLNVNFRKSNRVL